MRSLSNYRVLSYQIDGTLLRYDRFYDRDYLVCPVVALIGDSIVWSVTAPAPEFVPADVLRLSVMGWGYRPVVMNHPQVDGEFVSANTPQVLENNKFGFVFYPTFTELNQLSVEAWLDPIEAQDVPEAMDVIDRLQANEIVEVSCGQYVMMNYQDGEIDGQSYYGIWEQIMPDHLAMLSLGSVGACSVEMGCGANRIMTMNRGDQHSTNTDRSRSASAGNRSNKPRSSVSLVGSSSIKTHIQSPPIMRSCVLSQARTPKYTGTETGPWTVPNFTTYIRYLHPEAGGPASVSQCSQDIKQKIADHSLLGDPNGTNLNDLTMFPVVNPATGKLNQKALQQVVKFDVDTIDDAEGDQQVGSVTVAAVKSAQDIATRLLNSEFGLETDNMKNNTSAPKGQTQAAAQAAPTSASQDLSALQQTQQAPRGLIQRLMAWAAARSNNPNLSLRVESLDDSNRELIDELYEALRATVPMFGWILDVRYSSRQVIYTTDPGDWDDPPKLWLRGYSIATDGVTLTLADDVLEVEATTTYQPVSTTVDDQDDPDDENPLAPIIVATGTDTNTNCTCKDKGEPKMATAPVKDNKHQQTKKTVTAVTAASATDQPNNSNTPVVAEDVADDTTTNTNTGDQTVAISAEELKSLRAIAAQFKAQESRQRTGLIAALKAASKYTEDQLKAKDTEDLIVLADSLGVLPQQQDAHTSTVSYLGSRMTGRPNADPTDGDDDDGTNRAPKFPSIVDLLKNKDTNGKTN